MSRINTNVQSLIAQHVLGRQQKSVNTALERLSTGLRINSAKDDPGGLIASQNLRGQQAGLGQAISNTERANNIIGTAEGGLNEASALLTQLQALVTQTASSGGLTQSETNANQQQVDAILSSIDRIANGTQFGGKKLLDGTMAYTTSQVATGSLTGVNVNSAQLVGGIAKSVQVSVTASAQYGKLTHASGGGLASAITIQVTGNKGSQVLSFAAGTTVAAIKTAVNAGKSVTGVSATTSSSSLNFNSVGWSATDFVSVTRLQGTFGTTAARAAGRNATVNVNGQSAQVTGQTASLRTTSLDVDLTMASGFVGVVGNSTFYVTGGGANFLLGGDATTNNTASIGIAAILTGSLGNSADGFLSSLASGQSNSLAGGGAITAQSIVNAAVDQVSGLRARLGSFQKYTLDPTSNSLQVALENSSSAESAIRDADFASETSNMTRAQVLSQAASTVLSMANTAPQSVLALLRG